MGKSTCLETEAAADDLFHDLVGAAVDLLHPGVAPCSGNRVLLHVAVATVELEAAISDAVLEIGGPPLGCSCIFGSELASKVRLDLTIDEDPCDVELGLHLCQPELGVLERSDGLAEGGAILRVFNRPVEGDLRMTDSAQRKRQPLAGEIPHEIEESLTLFTEQIFGRNSNIFENQLGGVLRMEADLFEVASPAEPFHTLLDDQQAHAAVCLGRVGLGCNDHQTGVDAVGDEGLCAVQDVGVAVLDGRRPHACEVRPGAGFGHRNRCHRVA